MGRVAACAAAFLLLFGCAQQGAAQDPKVEKRVADVETALEEANNDIILLRSEIEALQENVGELEGQVRDLMNRVDDLESR